MEDPSTANAIGCSAALRQASQRHDIVGAHHGCAKAGGSADGVGVVALGLAVSSFAVALKRGRPLSRPGPGIQSPAGSLRGGRGTLIPGATGSASWLTDPVPGVGAMASRPAAAQPPGPEKTTGGTFGSTSLGTSADLAGGDSSGGFSGSRTSGRAAFWRRTERRGPGHQPGPAAK